MYLITFIFIIFYILKYFCKYFCTLLLYLFALKGLTVIEYSDSDSDQ